MASSSSSSRSCTYDVFPSFSGEDVRKSFLSHLLESLGRKSIDTFIDNDIDRSRPIGPELILAIRESAISVVVFSNKSASSTWCLNELLEIHKCFKELTQMVVIPIFYEVDPSHVRKQTGVFGKTFTETCEGKTQGVKQQWIQALAEVASLAGFDSRNWSNEAKLIEEVANDVLDKLLIITPSDCLGDFVGLEAHIKAMTSLLSVESEEARMVGILGPSGIGKTTIARALYSKLSSQFPYHAFVACERTNDDDGYGMKLCWEEQLLSKILDQKDIKVSRLGAVKQRLNRKKVLIVLDDVADIEILKTLVGQPGWFGPGSRVIVTTKDRQLLKCHKIYNIYEVEFPSRELALQMLCRSAFGLNSPPDGFTELAVQVVELAGRLPLGLNIIGSSLGGKDKEEWREMMPRLRDSLDGKIEKALRVSYEGLDVKDQELFLYIACLFNGHDVSYIRNVVGDSVNIGLKLLADKSLIRISPVCKTVEMHSLLQNLGKKINRGGSFCNPGKRRFLVDAEDICDVFTDNTGTETVLGIRFNTSEISEPLFIDEKSFQGMHNLRFLKFYGSWGSGEGILHLPQGLAYLSRKLRILYWDKCPLRFMPCNFKAEYLVELAIRYSKLERLWEGTQRLKSLKKMDLFHSKKLKEIPDLSYAINLEEMDLSTCESLVTLPCSIRNLHKLRELEMGGCLKLEIIPTDVNLESLDQLSLQGCPQLKRFPQISRNISELYLGGTAIEEESSLWIENLSSLTKLVWDFCPLRCLPSNFRPEYLVYLSMINSKLEKLWEGAQPLVNLEKIRLSGSENLYEFPNLSKATNLKILYLDGCKSLVTVPSSIQSLSKLCELNMERCTELEALPTNVNLESLNVLYLSGCSQLRRFPQISRSVERLHLDHTAIEEVPSWIEDFSELTTLMMRGCPRLRNISPNIFKLKCLEVVNFSDSAVKEFRDSSVLTRISRTIDDLIALFADAPLLLLILLVCGLLVNHLLLCEVVFNFFQGISDFFSNPEARLNFDNCLDLYGSAQTVILESDYEYAVLPGGEVPKFFTQRACGSSLSVLLNESSLSEEFIGFKACVVLEPLTDPKFTVSRVWVYCYFRGKYAVHCLHFDRDSSKMDHLLMFHFRFPTEELVECPSELDWEDMEFEFHYRVYDSLSLNIYSPDYSTETATYSVQRIKGCGVEFWDVFPRILTQSELDTHLCFTDDEDEDEEDEGDHRTTVWRTY